MKILRKGPSGFRQWSKGLGRRLMWLSQTEFAPSIAQGPIRILPFPERHTFVGLAWLLSAVVICHISFGTIVLSILMFIGPKDALSVAGRYMFSVLVCRIVLMYEIAGTREQFNIPGGGRVEPPAPVPGSDVVSLTETGLYPVFLVNVCRTPCVC